MSLYQLKVNNAPTIKRGDKVLLNHIWDFPETNNTFLTLELITDKCIVNTIKGNVDDCLLLIEHEPELVPYVITELYAQTAEEFYLENGFNPNEEENVIRCNVDILHPLYVENYTDRFQSEMIKYWQENIKPLYVI